MFSTSAHRYLLPLVFVGLYCLLSPVFAGTVYLKNGRVIRGPIMEKDDAGVVVGIDGGKMRIYKRFITAVVYDKADPGREEKTSPRREPAAKAATAASNSSTEGLPADPRELLDRLKRASGAPVPGRRSAPGASKVTRLASAENRTEAASGPSSAAAGLAEQAEGPVPGSSIRPPAGWKLSRSPGLVRFVAPGKGPLSASLELSRLDGPALATTACLRVLREEHHSMLDGCEVLDESFSRNALGREVFELTSRGRFDGREVTVHQRIIYTESNAWLLSAFRDSRDKGVGRLLSASIGSLGLAATKNVSRRP